MESTPESGVDSGPRGQAITAGLVTAVVGFTGAFAVVLTGLRAVGASPAQAASGLLAVTVGMGLAGMLLAWQTKLPITIAWSTPGAALLAATGVVGGWPEAVAAFVACGVLLAVVGLSARLARAVSLIPVPLANAMLAGVLLTICLVPARAVVADPLRIAPVIVSWLIVLRVARRWAAPAAMAVAVVVAIASPAVRGLGYADLGPHLELTVPQPSVAALLSLAIPLFVVTMASQNIPGIAVLSSFGFAIPLRRVLLTTGAATVIVAPAGGHAINLAAITAALTAGPEAGPDRNGRWRAAVTAGAAYVVIGLASTAIAAVALAAPAGLFEAAAGLALLPTFAGALGSAFGSDRAGDREGAAVALVVTVSGVVVLGVSAAFWGLLAGIATVALLRARHEPEQSDG